MPRLSSSFLPAPVPSLAQNLAQNLTLALALAAGVLAAPAAAQLSVAAVEPGQNASNVAPGAEIVVHFDRPIDVSAFVAASSGIQVFGKSTGPVAGAWSVDGDGRAARLVPGQPFAAGEIVQVSVSGGLQAADGSALRSAGFHFEYRVRTRPSDLGFTHIDTMSVRSSPNQGVRVYGVRPRTSTTMGGWTSPL